MEKAKRTALQKLILGMLTLSACSPTPVEVPMSAAPPQWTIPGCEAQLHEGAFCLALPRDEERLLVIGIETGTVCESQITSANFQLNLDASLGLQGTNLLFCADSHVTAVDLLTGKEEVLQQTCASVTADDSGIYIPDDNQVAVFKTIDDLRAGRKSVTYQTEFFASRFAVSKGTIFAAWHSDDKFQRYDPQTGKTSTVMLEGYDDWIQGIDAIEPATLVIAPPGHEKQELQLFDSVTGHFRRTIALSPADRMISGIVCQGRDVR